MSSKREVYMRDIIDLPHMQKLQCDEEDPRVLANDVSDGRKNGSMSYTMGR